MLLERVNEAQRIATRELRDNAKDHQRKGGKKRKRSDDDHNRDADDRDD